MTPQEKFVVEAFRLSRVSTPLWNEFQNAFELYAAKQFEDAIKAPVPDALVAHGKAQALMSLRDDFRNLEATYRKIEERENKRVK
jgi:hypothetical protein